MIESLPPHVDTTASTDASPSTRRDWPTWPGRGDAPDGGSGGDRKRKPALMIALLLVAVVSIAATCNKSPSVTITSPSNGTFDDSASILVTGLVEDVEPEQLGDVTVNGVSVLPLAGDGSFSTLVPLDPLLIANPIVAVVTIIDGPTLRDRVTVLAGDSVADGAFDAASVALRLTEGGLDAIEPTVTSLVDIDLATLLPPGTLVIDNFCYQDSIFGCLGRIDVTIHGSPAPSIGSYSIDVDPQVNFAEGDVRLNNLDVTARVKSVSGVGFTCYIDIHANTTDVFGDYTLSPDAVDPSEIDVDQLGGVAVAFGGFSDSTDCNGFLGFIVEALVSLFVGDVQGLMRPALQDFLNTPDGFGNTPIAGAIEAALVGIEIAGPIGGPLGVDLEMPLFAVDEDTGGITFGSDSRVTALNPDPEAADPTASHRVAESFPTFGATAPNGLPYHMAMSVSSTAFNQLLRAEVENGLLRMGFTEFDFGTGLQPITAGLLSAIVPEFAFLEPDEALQIQLLPETAPLLTGEPGPDGELAEIAVSHLLVRVMDAAGEVIFVEATIDLSVGLDLSLDGGALGAVIGTPPPEDIAATILVNRMGTPEVTLDALLPLLVSVAMPQLAGSIGSFPLPAFLDLELQLVDAARNGDFLTLFLDFSSI